MRTRPPQSWLGWIAWFVVLISATVAVAWFRPERPQGLDACLFVMWVMGASACGLWIKDRRSGEIAAGGQPSQNDAAPPRR